MVVLLALTVLPVEAATLRYEAYIAGVRVGQATVNVELVDNRYVVTGTAQAEGVVEMFSAWRTNFLARGELVDNAPQPAEYSYVERDDDQIREIIVRDGMLRYFKNGRIRRERPSPSGLDVLSALFVQPGCEAKRTIHTGRKHYRLTRIESNPTDVCRYDVVDDDDDHYRADIRLALREQLTVPVRITVRGFLTGKVVLVDH